VHVRKFDVKIVNHLNMAQTNSNCSGSMGKNIFRQFNLIRQGR
jgi:hypothetical protein